MSDFSLTLGPVAFAGFEIPSSITLGGRQRLAIHKLPGGLRIIDALGPDPADLAWSGIFTGPDAADRARLLDAMRVGGLHLPAGVGCLPVYRRAWKAVRGGLPQPLVDPLSPVMHGVAGRGGGGGDGGAGRTAAAAMGDGPRWPPGQPRDAGAGGRDRRARRHDGGNGGLQIAAASGTLGSTNVDGLDAADRGRRTPGVQSSDHADRGRRVRAAGAAHRRAGLCRAGIPQPRRRRAVERDRHASHHDRSAATCSGSPPSNWASATQWVRIAQLNGLIEDPMLVRTGHAASYPDPDPVGGGRCCPPPSLRTSEPGGAGGRCGGAGCVRRWTSTLNAHFAAARFRLQCGDARRCMAAGLLRTRHACSTYKLGPSAARRHQPAAGARPTASASIPIQGTIGDRGARPDGAAAGCADSRKRSPTRPRARSPRPWRRGTGWRHRWSRRPRTLAGRYYSDEHDRITLGQFARATTEWDLLTFLAAREGFEVFVAGQRRYSFNPQSQDTSPIPCSLTPERLRHPLARACVDAWRSDLEVDGEVVEHPAADRLHARRHAASRTGSARSGTVKRIVVVRPNLQSEARRSSWHNASWPICRRTSGWCRRRLPGELASLTPARSRMRLSAVPGTDFDQVYLRGRDLDRHLSVEHGFTQHVRLKNADAGLRRHTSSRRPNPVGDSMDRLLNVLKGAGGGNQDQAVPRMPRFGVVTSVDPKPRRPRA